jgi:hypothetical protein
MSSKHSYARSEERREREDGEQGERERGREGERESGERRGTRGKESKH